MPRPERKPDDIAYVHLTTHFDWIDRLRILFGREPRQRIAVSVWFPDGLVFASGIDAMARTGEIAWNGVAFRAPAGAVLVEVDRGGRPYMYVESECSVHVPHIFPERNRPMTAPVDGSAINQTRS